MFYLTHTETTQQMQEIATVVRSVADVRQLFVVAERKALTLHGTDSQIRIAEWLVNELNRPVADPGTPRLPNSRPHEYRVPGAPDEVVRVFYLTNTRNPNEMQEIAVAVRTVADIPRLFTYNTLKAMAVRGSAERVALAEWLVNELNRPAPTQPSTPQAQTVAHELAVPGSPDQVAKVFYFAHVEKPQELQEIATAVRSTANVKRVFINSRLTALSTRGTPDQIASAERLIKELDKPR